MSSLSKKIIAAAVSILVAACCILVLGSCGKKTDDTPSDTTQASSEVIEDNIIKGYSAALDENGVTVYKDGEQIQVISFSDVKLPGSLDLDFAKEHIEFIDLNFDGLEDMCISISEKKGVINHFCCINTETGFVFNSELSAVNNISVNSDDKQIVSESEKDGKKTYKCYEWVDGNLKEIKEIDAEESVPENVSKAASENAVGKKITPVKPTQAEKPAEKTTKPVTTKPNGKSTTAKPSTEPTKPAATESPNTSGSGVAFATNDIDEGWF